ncbi:MAG: hypothetical protein ACTSU2_09590 [Promethearchaeota archaeon]
MDKKGLKNGNEEGLTEGMVIPIFNKNFNFGIIIIIIILLLLTVVILLGFKDIKETQYLGISLTDFFTKPVFTKKAYTFLGTLTDYDRQLGAFRYNLISALYIAGLALSFSITPKGIIKNTSKDENIESDRHNEASGLKLFLDKNLKTLIVIGLIYFVLINLGSVLNWGYSWEELDGRFILLSDFYPQYFSTKLIAMGFLFLGAPYPYYLVRRHFYNKRTKIEVGRTYIVVSFIIFTLIAIFYPIYADIIISNESLMALLNIMLSVLFAFGVIFIFQSRIAKNKKHLKKDGGTEQEEINFHKETQVMLLWFFIGFSYFVMIALIYVIKAPWTSLNAGYFLLMLPDIFCTSLYSLMFYVLGLNLFYKGNNKREVEISHENE